LNKSSLKGKLPHDPADIIVWCQAYISDLLAIPADQIGADTEMADFGLDSSAAVAMVLDLEAKLGVELDPALLFEYPTLRAFAGAVGRSEETVLSEASQP
jgi:acyl carrier protein